MEQQTRNLKKKIKEESKSFIHDVSTLLLTSYENRNLKQVWNFQIKKTQPKQPMIYFIFISIAKLFDETVRKQLVDL